MATVSFTFSQLHGNPGVPVPLVHTCVNVAGAALSLAVNTSASSVFRLLTVPNGTTLVDFWLRAQTGGANQTIELGTSQTRSGIMSITTACQTFSISTQPTVPTAMGVFNQGWFRAPGGTQGGTGAVTDLMPVRISLSDDVQPAQVDILMKLGVAVSSSAFFTFMLFYTNNGMKGHTTIR